MESGKEAYELNQIKVEGSTSFAQDHFSIVICTLLNMEEEGFTLQMLNENSCVVKFQSAYSSNGELIP